MHLEVKSVGFLNFTVYLYISIKYIFSTWSLSAERGSLLYLLLTNNSDKWFLLNKSSVDIPTTPLLSFI